MLTMNRVRSFFTAGAALSLAGALIVFLPSAPATAVTKTKPRFVQVAQSATQAVALAKNGKVYAWGQERSLNGAPFEPPLCIGKAKVSTHTEYVGFPGGGGDRYVYKTRTSPALVKTPKKLRFTEVAAADGALLALSSKGSIYAWGNGPSVGLKGKGPHHVVACPQRVPLPKGVKIKRLVGNGAVAALSRSGVVYEWGTLFGDLYRASVTRLKPTKVATSIRFSSIWVDESSFFGRTASGKTYWWLRNPYAEPSANKKADIHHYYAKPHLLAEPTGVTFTNVTTGLAITASGQVYTWGANDSGQRGNGHKSASSWQESPRQIALPGGSAGVSVTGDFSSNFVVTQTGQVYAWGDNTSGKLGIGSKKARQLTPALVKIPGAAKVAQIAGGGNNAYLVLTRSGRIYGWGYNQSGTLGGKLQANYRKPRLVG